MPPFTVPRTPRDVDAWTRDSVGLSLDPKLIEQAVQLSGERTQKAAGTRAREEFIARRKQKGLLDLMGKLEWYTAAMSLSPRGSSRRNCDRTLLARVPERRSCNDSQRYHGSRRIVRTTWMPRIFATFAGGQVSRWARSTRCSASYAYAMNRPY
jgi:hypothetical protein